MLRSALALPVATALYECKQDGCHPSASGSMTQEVCFVSCMDGYLWPQPNEVSVSAELVSEPFSDCWQVQTDSELVAQMAQTFLPSHCSELSASSGKCCYSQFGDDSTCGSYPGGSDGLCNSDYSKSCNGDSDCEASQQNNLIVKVSLSSDAPADESYSLKAVAGSVSISAPGPLGARHALSTLSQLIARTKNGFVMSNEVHIADAPSKSYRGIMVDTSRHFMPIDNLKRIIRGMGMAKLNVLHLHLTDAQSFPLDVPAQQGLTNKGVYSPEQVYTAEDFQDLSAYAELRGVEVVPEIDAPAHVGKGWDEDMVVCHKDWENGGWAGMAVEPPSGQLNLANEAVYDVLGDIYSHLRQAFPKGSVFHLGGDEVIIGNDDGAWAKCWNSTLAQPILDMLESQGLDRNDRATFYGLWANFTKRSMALARDAGHKKFMLWAGYQAPNDVSYSLAQQPEFPSIAPTEDVTMMVWDTLKGTLAKNLTSSGYDVILAHSDYVYMDCGGSGWVRPGGYWCPLNEWYSMYEYMRDARGTFTAEEWGRVRGSQALSWSEAADEFNTEIRLWPRAAALAESLWSEPTTGWYEAAPRLMRFKSRLSAASIPSEAMQPTFCEQGPPNGCYLKPSSEKVVV